MNYDVYSEVWAWVRLQSRGLGQIGGAEHHKPYDNKDTIIIRLCLLYLQKDTCKIKPYTEREKVKPQNAWKKIVPKSNSTIVWNRAPYLIVNSLKAKAKWETLGMF